MMSTLSYEWKKLVSAFLSFCRKCHFVLKFLLLFIVFRSLILLIKVENYFELGLEKVFNCVFTCIFHNSNKNSNCPKMQVLTWRPILGLLSAICELSLQYLVIHVCWIDFCILQGNKRHGLFVALSADLCFVMHFLLKFSSYSNYFPLFILTFCHFSCMVEWTVMTVHY